MGGHSTKIADQSEASDVKRKAEHDARYNSHLLSNLIV